MKDGICTETGHVAGGAHCTCAAGYYRAASGNCELCEINTYCTNAREDIMIVARAQINSVSGVVCTQLQDCKCHSVMLVLTGVHVLRAKKIRINRVLVRRRVLIVHLACVDESGQLAWAGRITLGQAS